MIVKDTDDGIFLSFQNRHGSIESTASINKNGGEFNWPLIPQPGSDSIVMISNLLRGATMPSAFGQIPLFECSPSGIKMSDYSGRRPGPTGAHRLIPCYFLSRRERDTSSSINSKIRRLQQPEKAADKFAWKEKYETETRNREDWRPFSFI
jgi:hypothetical protein